jgi:hypothetical protein
MVKSRQSLKGIKNLGLPTFLTESLGSAVYVLKLILKHQESRCSENVDTRHRTTSSQFDPNNYIYSTRSIPTSLFMSNYKIIEFKLLGAILTKIEIF